MEGYRAAWVTDAVYDELVPGRKKLAGPPIPQQKQPTEPSFCSLIVDVSLGPDGPIIEESCGGPCGLLDRILGRECKRTIGGCSCLGGWFDRIFR